MDIDTRDKIRLLKMVLLPVMDHLGELAEDGNIDANDVVDFFGMGVAAIIDNDASLYTTEALQAAVDDAAILIARRTHEFRAMQREAGVSWFAVAMTPGPDDENGPPTIN